MNMDIFAGDKHHQRIEADHEAVLIERNCFVEISLPVFHLCGVCREAGVPGAGHQPCEGRFVFIKSLMQIMGIVVELVYVAIDAVSIVKCINSP